MQKFKLSDFSAGWLVGDFEPNIFRTGYFEFGIKYFQSGQHEPEHFQKSARELTVVIEGRCRIANYLLERGEVILIEPGEIAGFAAETDCALAIIKWPSISDDKVLA